VKGRDPLEEPRVLERISSLSSATFIGTIMDLLKFTLRLVDSAKEFNIAFRKKAPLHQPS
jgi:hypothetical protein